MSLDQLNLSVKAYNCLMRAGIKTIEDLCNNTKEDFIQIRNLGRKCLQEIIEAMKNNGLNFRDCDECNTTRNIQTIERTDIVELRKEYQTEILYLKEQIKNLTEIENRQENVIRELSLELEKYKNQNII